MTNSVAVITGASQGIGRATAVRLARDFSALVLVARNRANLESTARLARDTGTEVLVTDADLGEASVAQAVATRRYRSSAESMRC
jgi:3-oxoacyl-[acyl-carrier protein] reductase